MKMCDHVPRGVQGQSCWSAGLVPQCQWLRARCIGEPASFHSLKDSRSKLLESVVRAQSCGSRSELLVSRLWLHSGLSICSEHDLELSSI